MYKKCWKCDIPIGIDAEHSTRSIIYVGVQDLCGMFKIYICVRCASSIRNEGVSVWEDEDV